MSAAHDDMIQILTRPAPDEDAWVAACQAAIDDCPADPARALMVARTFRHTLNAATTAGVDLDAPNAELALAKYLADVHGAFPWGGPVGNNLTLAKYQARFRDQAAEHLRVRAHAKGHPR